MENKSGIKTEYERIYSLDFLRVISCVGICWLHYRLYLCPEGIFFGDRLINEEDCGWELKFFVEVFFGISGYLSFHQIDRIKKKSMMFSEFFKRKLIRILPMLFMGTVLYEIMVAVMVTYGRLIRQDFSVPSLWAILSSCFGVQVGWGFVSCGINVESWFLNVLLLCFVFFYFCIWLSEKWNINESVLFGIMVMIGCTATSYSLPIPFFIDQDGRGYEAFFAGLLLAGYIHRKGVNKKTGVVALTILIVYGVYHTFWPELLFFGKHHLMSLFVTPALIVLMEIPFMKRFFSWRGWGILGRITFCTYIFHVSMIFAIFNLETRLNLSIDYAHEVMLFCFIMLAFLFGAGTYFFVERPITRILTGQKIIEKISPKG